MFAYNISIEIGKKIKYRLSRCQIISNYPTNIVIVHIYLFQEIFPRKLYSRFIEPDTNRLSFVRKAKKKNSDEL